MTTSISDTQKHPLFTPTMLVIALLYLLTLVSAVIYILSARNYATHSGFLGEDKKSLTIIATRGETIELGVEVTKDGLGKWASEQGLILTMEGVKTPLVVVGPSKRDWGDTIDTYSHDPLTLEGSITIPSSIEGPQQRSLSGEISGTILYPYPSLFSFRETTENINIPVQLQLVPPGSIDGRFNFDALSLLTMLLSALLAAWSIWILIQSFVVRGQTSTFFQRIGGKIMRAVIAASLFWAVVTLCIETGLPVSPNGEITQRTLLISCIAGGTLLLNFITAHGINANFKK